MNKLEEHLQKVEIKKIEEFIDEKENEI